MMFFTLVGCAFTIMCVFVTPDLYWFGGICLIVSNTGFGASIVFYNSYLPDLAKNHPDVLNTPEANRIEARSRKEDEISAVGFIAGYASTSIPPA